MSRSSSILPVLLLLISQVSAQVDSTATAQPLSIYEPNRVGFTWDSNDPDLYLDFHLSLVYRFPGMTSIFPNYHDGPWAPDSWHFAFSTRLAQYIGTRDSSPVIGKRFNPKFFVRYDLAGRAKLDVGYGHESNGQSIHELPQFQAARERGIRSGDGSHTADDLISRGWDYLELRLSTRHDSPKGKIAMYTAARAFLHHGLLQEDAENTYFWERKQELEDRSEVHGLSVMLRYEPRKKRLLIPAKIAAHYETGTWHPFTHNSLRLELRFDLGGLPLLVWGTSGFDHDLAQFNRRGELVGLALEFKPLLDEEGGI